MKTIQVNTGRPYRIQIGSGLLDQAPALIAQAYGDRRPRLAVITDDTVDQFYGDHLTALLERAGYPVCKFVFPHGEQSTRYTDSSRKTGSPGRTSWLRWAVGWLATSRALLPQPGCGASILSRFPPPFFP